MHLPLHKGARVTFTKNIHKECDYVYGMGAVVLSAHRRGVRVQTDTGYIVMVYPWTEIDETTGVRHTFYPLRLGYSHTLMKVQGSTMNHLTVYLDVANVEAAAYVALSRVQYDAHWRFVGNPTVHHFTPATSV